MQRRSASSAAASVHRGETASLLFRVTLVLLLILRGCMNEPVIPAAGVLRCPFIRQGRATGGGRFAVIAAALDPDFAGYIGISTS